MDGITPTAPGAIRGYFFIFFFFFPVTIQVFSYIYMYPVTNPGRTERKHRPGNPDTRQADQPTAPPGNIPRNPRGISKLPGTPGEVWAQLGRLTRGHIRPWESIIKPHTYWEQFLGKIPPVWRAVAENKGPTALRSIDPTHTGRAYATPAC